MSMRFRFAPSPTGHLHIGGARTALFNWLLARKHDGVFLLRIEDTDRARSKAEHEAQVLRDMAWMGLDWDEGPSTGGEYGPYRQSERQGRYDTYIARMLDEGTAYRCTCSKERLTQVREAAQAKGEKPKYDRHCRNLNLGPDCGDHVVRFKAPLDGETVVKDLVKGDVTFRNEELDDLIIQRTDGSPTYNFVVVIDDHEMKVTHVVRGDDHLNNTPKQQLLYEALGLPVPAFGHLPIILGDDGGKMSKRHGSTSVGAYRENGFLPEALFNYLTRVGWACGDMEHFTAEEAIAARLAGEASPGRCGGGPRFSGRCSAFPSSAAGSRSTGALSTSATCSTGASRSRALPGCLHPSTRSTRSARCRCSARTCTSCCHACRTMALAIGYTETAGNSRGEAPRLSPPSPWRS